MLLRLFNGAAQRKVMRACEEWLENVDRTHLVLASGKLVAQKYIL